jgi:hypothetical protein
VLRWALPGVRALIGAGVGVVGGHSWNQHEVAGRQASERWQQQLDAAYRRGVQSGERRANVST